ncbi:MarR family winged helix-turn-helix transcriptional regulator, partial [Leucobacter soli]
MSIRLANEAWEAVMTAHARLNSRFAAERMWAELSMREYDVLYTLAKRGEPMRLSEVHHGVLLSQPALSRLVDRLEARGLVAREVDAEDRRAIQISLTEAGAEAQRSVGRQHAR